MDNLTTHWDEAVELVGPVRARVWRLYMLGAVVSFEVNDVSVHQVLAVKTPADGVSAMPLTRALMV